MDQKRPNTIANNRPKLLFAFKILVSLGFLALLQKNGHLTFAAMEKLFFDKKIYVVLFLSITLGYEFAKACQIYFLIHLQGKRIDLKSCFKITVMAHLFDLFLPGQGGGLAARSYYLNKASDMSLKETASVIFLEMYLLLLVILQILILSLFMQHLGPLSPTLSWILAALSISLAVLSSVILFSKKILIFPTVNRPITAMLGFSFFGGITAILKTLVFFICANHLLGYNLGFFQTMASFLVGALLTLIPTGPASIGGGHYFFQSSFNLFSDLKSNLGVELFNVMAFCHLVMAFIGFFIYWLAPPKRSD